MLKRVSGRFKTLLRNSEPVPSSKSSVPHLLVVDDEASICFSMKEYFSRSGFVVDTAHELGEAEELIENGDYQVIIQDLRLGLTSNPEGLAIIRMAQRHNPKTRIVVLTAYGSSENEIEAIRSGAHAFLRKPQRLSQLAQVVYGLIDLTRSNSGNDQKNH